MSRARRTTRGMSGRLAERGTGVWAQRTEPAVIKCTKFEGGVSEFDPAEAVSSGMVVDVVPEQALRPGPRVGWKPFALGLVVGCLLAVLVFTIRPAPPADTPTRAVDLYVSARGQGDRGAMAKILDGNAGLRASKLSEVDGRPVHITAVSITRSDISDGLYNVTVTWTDASHPVSTDRLLVLPRPGDPSASPEWSVSVAP